MSSKKEISINGVNIEWDLERGHLSFFSTPSALFWIKPSLLSMLKPLADEVGHDLYKLQVAYSASMGTEEDYYAMVNVFGKTFEEGFIKWSEAVSTAGWGIFELAYRPESKSARVKIFNTWELLMQQDLDSKWGCPFIQGKIIGIFTHALGVNCWADVVDICYDGDMPYVEFDIYESQKTISKEIEKEKIKLMRQKERVLSNEVELKTRELKAATLSAQSANVEKSKFLASMSHELLNPLNGILGFAQLLELDKCLSKNEEGSLYLKGILESGQMMQSLIADLLTYDDFATEEKVIQIEDVNYIDVIKEACEANNAIAIQNNITIKLSQPPKEEPIFLGSYVNTYEILHIFLSNASKYTPANSEVEIGIEKNSTNEDRFFVSDNGPGIKECHLSRLFTAFDRLDHQSGNISGSGVGLSIANIMADKMGGSIGYCPSEMGGSKFWLALPIKTD